MDIQLVVFADDLTGAGDTAAQFTKAGFSARVLVDTWTADEAKKTDVAVVDTDSRCLGTGEAAEAIRAAAARLGGLGAVPVYKKIDSTMRGNIGAEIDALMEAAELPCALLCPAFPANGRTVVGGNLLVRGRPVARSAEGNDMLAAVAESHIPTLVGAQSKHVVMNCSTGDLESRRAHELLDKAVQSAAIVICDAVSDNHLREIARLAWKRRKEVLCVGSAGLAGPLACLMNGDDRDEEPDIPRKQAEKDNRQQANGLRTPVIVAVGSLNPVSREQARFLADSGAIRMMLSPLDVFGNDGRYRTDALGAACVSVMARGNVPLVVGPDKDSPTDVEGVDAAGAALGFDTVRTAAAIARALASVVGAFVAWVPHAAVVATGGDVAQAVLRELQCTSLDVVGEVTNGIPLCRIHGGRFANTRLVTKAGGFGNPDALVQAVAMLSR